MWKVLIIVIFGLITKNTVAEHNLSNHTNHKCKEFENKFKDGLKLYYTCAVANTHQQFWVCANCSTEFSEFFYGFELLKTTPDRRPGYENQTCIKEVVDVDRMNYWARIRNEAVKLWEDANCYKCYDWNGTLINKTEFQVQNYTEDFKLFLNLSIQIDHCMGSQPKNVSICDVCATTYTELNKFYEGIKKKYKSNMCFDIENAMNKTRLYWSGTLGCCHDEKTSFLWFTVFASVIGSLPLVFYLMSYYVTVRSEDLTPVNDGERQITANVSSINNQDPMPSTSSGGSNASTAEDNSLLVINNRTKLNESNPYKAMDVKNIVKNTYIDISKNINNVPGNSRNPDANERLIDLSSTPPPISSVQLNNFESNQADDDVPKLS
uniref:CSON008248 protein n=1 Tax=Culicoides sonorensis TaxID=179676 RepID=A0A336LEY2_CULSO